MVRHVSPHHIVFQRSPPAGLTLAGVLHSEWGSWEDLYEGKQVLCLSCGRSGNMRELPIHTYPLVHSLAVVQLVCEDGHPELYWRDTPSAVLEACHVSRPAKLE